MPTCTDIALLASYNAHMNRKLYSAAADLPSVELHANRGAFFTSIFGTLNHLVAGDTIWLMRFALHPSQFHALSSLRDGPIPSDLTQAYADNLPDLEVHRTNLDGVIVSLSEELRQSDLELTLTYRNSRGREFHKNFGQLLLHFFNHQTHHRGQASTLLSQAGIDIGITDLLEIVLDEPGV